MYELPTSAELVRRIRPATIGDRYLNGRLIGARLMHIASAFESHVPGLATLLQDASLLIASEELRGGTIANPARGTVKSNRIAAALTPASDSTGPCLGDPVRAAILIALIRRLPGDNSDPAEGLTRLITDLDSVELPFQIESVRRLAPPLYRALSIPSSANTFTALDAMRDVLLKCSVKETPSQALHGLLKQVLKEWPVLPRKAHTSVQSSPSDDGSLLLEHPSTCLDQACAADEIFPLAPAEAREFTHHTERNAAERSGYLLSRSLCYGEDQSLLVEEGQQATQQLVELARQFLATGYRLEAGAAVTYLLCFLTGRGFIDLANLPLAQSGNPPSHQLLQLDIEHGEWLGEVAGFGRFWKPQPDTSRFFQANGLVRMPIPIVVLDLLRQLFAFDKQSPESVVMSGASESIQAPQKLVREKVQNAVTPRFTDGRVRLTLAATILRNTGESCFAHIILGHSLGQSTAPLHYFCVTPKDLSGVYRQACEDSLGLKLPDSSSSADATEPRIGAPLAAAEDPLFEEYVSLLKAETRDVPRKHDVPKVLKAYCSLVRYTSVMWGAATGHRMNNNLGDVSLANIDERGWAVMSDKPTDSESTLRSVVLPPILLRQIENLRLVQLEIEKICTETSARDELKNARLGSGPLFILVDEDGQARKLTAEDLQHPWLKNRGLPRYWLRMRLRMALTRMNVSPELVYRQMGHVNNGLTPYGDMCPVSLGETSLLLAGSLDRCLTSDGWTPLPAATTRMKPLPGWKGATLATPLGERWSQYLSSDRKGWEKRRNDRYLKETTGKQKAIDEWVQSCIRQVVPSFSEAAPETGIRVTEQHVADWLDSLNERNPALGELRLSMWSLRRVVKKLRKTAGWKGVLPPKIISKGFEPPPIGFQHVQASRLMHRLRRHAIRDAFGSTPDVWERMRCRLALLLISDYTVLDPEQLTAVIEQIVQSPALSRDPRAPDRVLCVVTTLSRYHRSIRLSKAASLAAVTLRDAPRPEKKKSLAAILATSLPPGVYGRGTGNAIERLFRLQALSLRIDRPGVLWPLLERGDIHTLTPECTIRLQTGSVAALDQTQRSSGGNDLTQLVGTERRPARNADVRITQYRTFTRELSTCREPTRSDQGLDHMRYTRAKALVVKTLNSNDLDDTVRLLVLFGKRHIVRKKRDRIRVGTAYDYLTQIGSLLISCLDDRSLSDLGDDELDDVFNSVIEETPKARRPQVVRTLLDFYYTHEAVLARPDLESLAALSRETGVLSVRAVVVTDAEYMCIRQALLLMNTSGQISRREYLQATLALALMWRIGLRTREITHRSVGDVIHVGNVILLAVRSTTLGLVKTYASRRVVNLSLLLSDPELAELAELLNTADEDHPESGRKTPPLFIFGKLGETPLDYDNRKGVAADLLKIVREAIRAVTGEEAKSLHVLRHSAASRGITAVMVQRPTQAVSYDSARQLFQVGAQLGHSRFSTSFQFYWHLSHLIDWLEDPLTSEDLGRLTDKTGAAIRQSRTVTQDVTESILVDTPPVLGPELAHRIVDRIGRGIEPDSQEMVMFFALLAVGLPLNYLLNRVRCSRDAIVKILGHIDDISIEKTLVFWPTHLNQDFEAVLGFVGKNSLSARGRHSADNSMRRRSRTNRGPTRVKTIIPRRRVLQSRSSIRSLTAAADSLADFVGPCLDLARHSGGPVSTSQNHVLTQLKSRYPKNQITELAWVTAINEATHRVSIRSGATINSLG